MAVLSYVGVSMTLGDSRSYTGLKANRCQPNTSSAVCRLVSRYQNYNPKKLEVLNQRKSHPLSMVKIIVYLKPAFRHIYIISSVPSQLFSSLFFHRTNHPLSPTSQQQNIVHVSLRPGLSITSITTEPSMNIHNTLPPLSTAKYPQESVPKVPELSKPSA